MNKVDNFETIKEIYELLEKAIKENFAYIGRKKWGDPSGNCNELDVYEIGDGTNKVWLSTAMWPSASTGEINRCGIITTITNNMGNALSQILEINIPYYFSKSFNTRVYELGNEVEIRHYGRFTIGRRGLKKKYFFDYLREHGYEDEIKYDEEGKEYINFITLKNKNVDVELLKSRLIKLTMLLKEFKDYYREVFAH